jgi:UrcA family protein
MLKQIVPVLALAALATPGTALAGGDQEHSVTVSHKGLDLARHLDRLELDRRVRDAARQACYREFRGSTWLPVEMSSCVARTIRAAEPAIATLVARGRQPLAAAR